MCYPGKPGVEVCVLGRLWSPNGLKRAELNPGTAEQDICDEGLPRGQLAYQGVWPRQPGVW